MTHRFRLFALSALVTGVVACTSLVALDAPPASEAGPVAADASGGAMDASIDSNAAPALDAGVDAPASNAGPTLLVLGGAVYAIEGITSDGWVLYAGANTTHVVPMSGGASTLIATGVFGEVDGKVALAGQFGPTGPFVAWSSATGVHTDVCEEIVMPPQVSADGTRLLRLVRDPTVDAATGLNRLILSDLAFGGAVDLGPVWGEQFQFARTDDRFVIGRELPMDGGTYTTCDSYTGAGVATHLFDGYCGQVDGDRVVSADDRTGALVFHVRTADGGPVSDIAAPGDSGIALSQGILSLDGSVMVLADLAGTLWSWVPGGVVTRLPNTPAIARDTYFAFSPDSAHFWFVDSTNVMWIARSTAGNAVRVASPGNHYGLLTFTTDGRYVAFVSSEDLIAAPVDSGTPVTLAGNVACDTSQTLCILPAHDSTIVYLSGGDLWSVDLDATSHPTLLARSVVTFAIDPAGRTAVYNFQDSSPDAASGLYSVSIP
jgi:hypothetical protein